jgi:hypothetical protein
MMMSVEQHLMRLQWVGADDERPAVAELAVCNLQFGASAADNSKILLIGMGFWRRSAR